MAIAAKASPRRTGQSFRAHLLEIDVEPLCQRWCSCRDVLRCWRLVAQRKLAALHTGSRATDRHVARKLAVSRYSIVSEALVHPIWKMFSPRTRKDTDGVLKRSDS